MIYIDSDGVVSNFREWARRHINEAPTKDLNSDLDIDYIMLMNYKTVFYNVPETKNAKDFFTILKNEDSYILSAVPSVKRLYEEFPNMKLKEIIRRINVMVENKYKWFEERGIPRDKVIVVKGSSKKAFYCKKGDILFDDYEKNINRWLDVGGIGVLVKSEGSRVN